MEILFYYHCCLSHCRIGTDAEERERRPSKKKRKRNIHGECSNSKGKRKSKHF